MATDDTRYPILVDTDALIAVANSPLCAQLTDHIGLTTTNVCKKDLNGMSKTRGRPRQREVTHTGFVTGAVSHLMRSKTPRHR